MPGRHASAGLAEASRTTRYAATKVPPITAMFWIVKLLTTGMGEAASDWLGGVNVVLAGGVGVIGFALALRLQFGSDRYVPQIYWFAVAMVALFGTMVADGLHVVLALPYAVTTALYAAGLALVFWLWFRSEGTLSIHTITTARRERFYWLTVLLTFALGTAAGDLTATAMGLGFFSSGLVFGAAILCPLAAWRLGVNPVIAFWIAYVITRPLGASFADWLGKPPSVDGGLGYGDGPVTWVATTAIVALVAVTAAHSSRSRRRASDA